MAESGEGFLSDGGIDWGEVKGRKEGERGVLIGWVLMAITRERISGGVTPATVSETERGREICGEEEDGSDGRVPHVGEGERDSGVPVRVRLEWAAGLFPSWAEGFPGVRFIFFSSFLFSFSIFLFLL
jgi:hypothetical protein